jgi:hypothetical protein
VVIFFVRVYLVNTLDSFLWLSFFFVRVYLVNTLDSFLWLSLFFCVSLFR